jgi:hypothetical protein
MINIAKISSQLILEDLARNLKLKKQHYLMILPQSLLQKYGIDSEEISFNLAIDDSDKLTLIGPKISSQPKSDISNSTRGEFVT